MNVLVTGGAGYLGGHLVANLIGRGHAVEVVDRFLFKPSARVFEKEFPELEGVIEADYRDLGVEDLKRFDAVFHLAAMGSDPAAAIDVEETYDNNTFGAVRLARRARLAGVGAFVFASSCSVYGLGQGFDLTPKAECHPVSEYGASKLAAEDLLKYEAPGLRIARLGTLAGPGFPVTRTRFDLVLNIMTLKGLEGKIIVTGGGTQWRPLIDVRNAAHAMVSLLNEDEDTYNLVAYNIQPAKLAQIIAANGAFTDADRPHIEIIAEAPDKRDYHARGNDVDYGPLLYMAESSSSSLYLGLENGSVRVEPDTYDVWARTLDRKSERAQAVTAG